MTIEVPTPTATQQVPFSSIPAGQTCYVYSASAIVMRLFGDPTFNAVRLEGGGVLTVPDATIVLPLALKVVEQ